MKNKIPGVCILLFISTSRPALVRFASCHLDDLIKQWEKDWMVEKSYLYLFSRKSAHYIRYHRCSLSSNSARFRIGNAFLYKSSPPRRCLYYTFQTPQLSSPTYWISYAFKFRDRRGDELFIVRSPPTNVFDNYSIIFFWYFNYIASVFAAAGTCSATSLRRFIFLAISIYLSPMRNFRRRSPAKTRTASVTFLFFSRYSSFGLRDMAGGSAEGSKWRHIRSSLAVPGPYATKLANLL